MSRNPQSCDLTKLQARRVWLREWNPDAASGMAVFTAILRSYQLLNDEVQRVMRRHDLTFARYEVLAWDIRRQYEAILRAGISVEPWTGPPNSLNRVERTIVRPERPLEATMSWSWRRLAG